MNPFSRCIGWSLLILALGCGPDVSVSPGDPGNLTGVWIGKGVYEQEQMDFTVWIEQDGEALNGVYIIGKPVHDYEAYPASHSAACNIHNGRFQGSVAELRLPYSGFDLMASLAYSRQQESLEGKWGVDTDLADIAGTLSLTRISMLPVKISSKDNYRSAPLGCSTRPKPACADGKDNDGDKLVDAKDPGCGRYGLLLGNREDTSPSCADRWDNDGDGLVDSLDPDCMESNGQELSPKPACADGKDNDGDGLVDLADPGCQNDPRRALEVAPICADGKDNDGDKLVDDKDPDCKTMMEVENVNDTACSNGHDDDGDGLMDLKDPSCNSPKSQHEWAINQCNDGLDNDGDKLTDLKDSACVKKYRTMEAGA